MTSRSHAVTLHLSYSQSSCWIGLWFNNKIQRYISIVRVCREVWQLCTVEINDVTGTLTWDVNSPHTQKLQSGTSRNQRKQILEGLLESSGRCCCQGRTAAQYSTTMPQKIKIMDCWLSKCFHPCNMSRVMAMLKETTHNGLIYTQGCPRLGLVAYILFGITKYPNPHIMRIPTFHTEFLKNIL